ncbi:MAG: hypothetical protein WD749_04840 [Phycisphaerales bacterium]
MKLCTRCGQDCSTRPRVKTPQGQYTCRACLRPDELSVMETKPQARAAVGAGALAPGRMPAPAIPIHPAARNGDAAAMAALPDDDAPLTLADLETAATAEQLVCPSCQSSVAHGAALCVQCGYDLHAGKHLQTQQGRAEEPLPKVPPAYSKCPKCKYDLKGLKQPRCPECGTLVLKKDHKEHMREFSRREARWAYLKPLIQMTVGMLVMAFFLAVRGKEDEIPWYIASCLIQVPFGCMVFFACCLLWIGFDAPMHLTAIRLAGVYAITEGLAHVMSLVPMPLMGWIAWLLIYAALLAESLDLEFNDAIFVALFSFVVKIALVVAIYQYLFSQM